MMDIQVFLKTFNNEVAAFLLLNAALAPSARRFQGSISIYIYMLHTFCYCWVVASIPVVSHKAVAEV